MKTVKDAYNEFKGNLAHIYSIPETDAITSLVLNDLTGLSKARIKAFTDTELTIEQSQRLSIILKELKTGKPVQYILGHTEFYGLNFLVNSTVLIPRPETEELVEWILRTIPPSSNLNILDIGTGSGCIPIILKSHLINNKLFAIDISLDALQTAKRNAELNNVEITFVEANALNLNHPVIAGQQYGVIVSNPPYVTLVDKKQMHYNVTGFEPHTALFVPDESPLLFYIAIADFAAGHLINNGYLFFEINESYGPETVDMLTSKGFTQIELRQDMAGKDRMIKAVLAR
ncbi:peptide chain release factor N(5)-glutamine methyltransferase [Mucilaginibacter terrae]|uniref:peptide chain release factor N(5)-glutamine methyltransferase n=1 Tax=Mucilaginibacter terrae TaxID=1955052 RepID=UPI0036308AD9